MGRCYLRLIARAGIVFAATAAATFLDWVAPDVLSVVPLMPFFAAVGLATWAGGWRGAWLPMLAGAITAKYLFLAPTHSLAVESPLVLLRLTYFVAVSAFIATLIVRLRTEHREAQRSQRIVETLLNSVSDGIVTVLPNGRILFANPAAAEMAGFSSVESFVGSDIHRIYDNFEVLCDSSPSSSDRLKLGLRGEQPPDGIMRVRHNATGREMAILLRARPVLDPESHQDMTVIISTDVGDLERAEREKAEIIAAAPDPMIITDPDGRITMVNRQAEEKFGYNQDELRGRPVEMLVPDRLRTGHAQHRADYSAAPHARPMGTGLELHARRKDGSEFPVEVSLSPLAAAGPSCVITIVRDITERRKAEERRSALLASMTHDVKNPLASIKLIAGLAERRVRQASLDQDQLLAKLQDIQNGVSQAVTILDNLMQVARHELGVPVEPQKERCDLALLVEGLVVVHQSTTDAHRIRLELPREGLVGMWDEAALTSVMDNLLSNAVKYSPGGGEIKVTIRTQETEGERWALVSVQDAGVGIPQDDLAHVFQQFYRGANASRATGTGVGLAAVKEIVEAHGGTVRVESAVGSGSTFSVLLPLEDIATSERESAAPGKPSQGGRIVEEVAGESANRSI